MVHLRFPTTGPIQAAFCFDEAFLTYAAVATGSLLLNREADVTVHWCVPRSAAVPVRRFLAGSILSHLTDIRVVDVDHSLTSSWTVSEHIAPASYLRLHIADAIHVPRLIYIDCDTLVTGALDELYATDLGPNYVAAVPDKVGGRYSRMSPLLSDTYVNTGVMLLDLDRLRADDMLGRCAELHAQHTARVTYADQCLINKFADGRKLILPERWNRIVYAHKTSAAEFQALTAAGGSQIVHFAGHVKPWSESCPDHVAAFWWSYADRLGLGRG